MAVPKGRILCTDDDADTRELLTLTLEVEGYEVICTDDALKTIDLIKTEDFDLCLVDNWMPGISGYDLCNQIRQFNTKMPILFYSGDAFESDKQRALDLGAQGYVVKPALDNELVTEVARLIAEAKVAFPVAIVPPTQESL
jgi:CheY-like chemotaxis protein